MSDGVPTVLFVRLRRGLVGETRRVVHIVPIPALDAIPAVLTAYCGLHIRPGTADLLPEPQGMPCVRCLAKLPLPDHHQLPKRPYPAIQQH
jgi:hypothetical protein